MSKAIKNPYRPGAYNAIFAVLMAARKINNGHRGVSVDEILKQARGVTKFDTSVVCSPRKDTWGSRSAKSADYFCEPVKCKDGIKRFAMKPRAKTMTQPDWSKPVIKAKKARSTAKVTTPAKAKAKARK